MANPVSKRKTVLFVDDETEFLELLQPYMERLSQGLWTVIVADNSATALSTLESRHVDLVVLDVRMPVMDGVQLLSLIQRKHPQIKKAVLSGHIDDSCRASAFGGGAELVLEKPRDAAGYQALFAALNELLQMQTEQGFRGVLRRVGLEDIIQMECLSRHSLILEISARGLRGRLYIRDGSLVHAECADLVGEPALQKVLTFKGGEFQHRAFDEPPRETLEGSWEFLLMEAVRRRDELAAEQGEEPVPELPEFSPEVETGGLALPGGAPQVNELVVVTQGGEILYSAQSPEPQQRGKLCLAVMETAEAIGSQLPTGNLERVEFVSAPGRMLVRIQDEHGIFILANVS